MVVVSVIMPVYNSARYLTECLDSILVQTFKEIEIICINDGSTDKSLQILKDFQTRDARIKIIDQENAGVSAARNAGLQIATGTYMLLLDADDVLNSEDFAEAVDQIRRAKDDVIFFNFGYLLEDKKVSLVSNIAKSYNCYSKETVIIDYVKWNLKIIMGSFLVRNDVIKKNQLRFNVGQSYAEDVEFIIMMMYYAESITVSSQTIAFYRKHPDSAVMQVNYERFGSYFSRKKLRQFFAKSTEFEELLRIYDGYLLPEAVIMVIEIFSRAGKNFYKLRNFLRDNQMCDYLAESCFNEHTPALQKVKIQQFIRNPLLYYLSNRFSEIRYQLKVYLFKKIRTC